MVIEIVVPQVGEAVAEVTLVRWLKSEGDDIKAGEALFEVDTDKAVVEVEAFAAGRLSRILAPAGSAVMPQQVVGLLEPAPTADAPRQAQEVPVVGHRPDRRATPVARRLAAELGLEVSQVQGSGAGGRVVTEDLRQLAGPSAEPQAVSGRILASPKARRLAREVGLDLAGLVGTGVDGLITTRDIQAATSLVTPVSPAIPGIQPLSRLRRTIAARMQASKQTVPHFYLTADVDMAQAQQLRAYCRQTLTWEEGPSYTDIFVRACALALKMMPEVNVRYTDTGLERRETADIGVAVGLDEGLLVPVLPEVNRLNLREVSKQIYGLAERARTGRLRDSDLGPKSMVVSNLGMYGVESFFAIIDMPDPMILAVGRIAERVVPLDRRPVIRPMCTLSLSVDHRVLDGVQGARFLGRVKTLLENPFEILGETR